MKNRKNVCNFVSMLVLVCLFFLNNVSVSSAEELDVSQTKSLSVSKSDYRVLSSKYTFSPGDIFSFSVYDEPDLKQDEIIVKPDGYATIDPVGEVYVAGDDIDSVVANIKEKMLPFIRNPHISIKIKSYSPPNIYVYGAVQHPGVYQLHTKNIINDVHLDTGNSYINVSNIVNAAGGITGNADLSKVEVISASGKKAIVNLWNMIVDGDISQNLMLKPNDKIYVPSIETIVYNDDDFKVLASSSLFPAAFPIRVMGEVGKPGLLHIPSHTPYLNSAIAMAEGFNLDANKVKTIIYRKNPNGSVVKIAIDPQKADVVLRPDDLVDVTAKGYITTVRFADRMNRIIAPFYTLGGTCNWWADFFKPKRRGGNYNTVIY